MASLAITALRSAVKEVSDLARADRSSLIATPASLRLARAVGRARVVLLSSHFERYLRAVNEEAISFLNGVGVPSGSLPELLRLLHSKGPIDELAETQWDRRRIQLDAFAEGDAWLWTAGGTGVLTHARILEWMKAPKPDSLVRYYRYWGIRDVFNAITRTPHNRNRLWLGVQELVDKRNNIAHGDFTAYATPVDVRRYVDSVVTFCDRADRVLSRVLGTLVVAAAPW